MNAVQSDIANPILYRLYFALILPDILHKKGMDATAKNKEDLHEFHKKILQVDSIAGKSQEFVSRFLLEVVAWWAIERGLFIRTNKKMPHNIDQMTLHEAWQYL